MDSLLWRPFNTHDGAATWGDADLPANALVSPRTAKSRDSVRAIENLDEYGSTTGGPGGAGMGMPRFANPGTTSIVSGLYSGGARRNRTDDLFNAIAEGQLLFQWVTGTFITTVYNSRRHS